MSKRAMTVGATLLAFFGSAGTLAAQSATVCGTNTAADAASLTCKTGELDGIAELTKLEKLQVRSGSSSIDLQPLAGHPTLEVLDLAGTSVTDEDLQHLAKVKNLEALSLEGTRVTDEGLSALGSLLVLRKLSLKGTEIDGSGLKDLAKLPFLKWIDLSNTKLNDEAILELAKLKPVREMSLDGTDLSVAGVERLAKNLPNAEIRAVGLGKPFEVCGQQVTVDVKRITCEAGTAGGSNLKHLQKVTHLKTLMVRGGDLGERAVRYIRGERLERIDLTGTSVNDRALARLGNLPALKMLNLSKTRVTDDGLSELEDLENLREVFVAGTAVTPAGEAAFKKIRPDVRVVR